jgi:hypothetical protein
MTHTLFRRGELEGLKKDFVVLGMCATGITHTGSAAVKKKIYEILIKHPHVNSGEVKTGSEFNADLAAIRQGFEDTSVVHCVFEDKDVVIKVLEEIEAADLGVSIVLTGVFEETETCCRRAGLRPHTVEHSAGVMGRTEKLPEEPVLDITTMCGHGLVAPGLVLDMVKKVRGGKLTLSKAAARLAEPCICGIFNPTRAQSLLAAIV